MKIAVALNPASGNGRGLTYRQIIRDVLEGYPVTTQWLPVGSQHDSMAAVRELSTDVDALVVVGGDGFIHTALNALNAPIPLGIIAVGSGNDIAREFDLPIHNVHDSIHQIASALLAGRYREVDVMQIDWSGGSRRALAIVSVGIDADASLRANRMAWPQGNLRYVRAAIESLRDYKPYGLELTMNGHTHAGSMTLLSIANTRFFGGGFCIAPAASPDDGLLDVVVTPGFRYCDLAARIPKLVLIRHTLDPHVHVFRTAQATIADAPEHGAPLPIIMADGEEICRAPATVTVVERALRLVM